MNIPVQNGESTLSRENVVNTLGQGDQRNAYSAIFDAFQNNFGRTPTQQELDQFYPTFALRDVGQSSGNAAVAQYASSISNSPSNIAAQQQKQALDAYSKNPDQYNSQLNSVFQNSVGRQASADELQHFGSLLASGQVDQYGVGQLLGQTAEAQNYQTQNYQNQLSKNLQGTQGDYFKNYIEPSILSQTAQAGRDPNSSGVQQAEVQAGKQQNYDLQNYIAQFGAGQYGQSAQNQQGVYQQYLGNLYGIQNANVNQQLNQQSYLQQQNTNLQNYQLQQQAYNNYLNQYGNRSNGLGSLIGGVAGAGLGAFGGPAGSAAGFQIGSSLGGGIQGGIQGQGYSQQPNAGFNYGGLPTSWGSPSRVGSGGSTIGRATI